MDQELISKMRDDPTVDLSIFGASAPEGVVIFEPGAPQTYSEPDQTLLQNLPEMQVSFKLVEDEAERLVSLKEIDADLCNEGTIDVTRADIVAESFKGFYSAVPKGSFTKVPTKSGLRETRGYIKQEIATEEAQLVDGFKTYLGKPFQTGLDMLVNVKDSCFPALQSNAKTLQEEFGQQMLDLYNDPSRTDFHAQDLASMKLEGYQTQLRSEAEFMQAVAAIQRAMQNESVFTFFHEVLADPKKDGVPTVCLNNLFLMATSPKIQPLLESKLGMIVEKVKEVSEFVKQAQEICHQPEQVSAFIIGNSKQFGDFMTWTGQFCGLTYNLTLLTLAIKQLVKSYVKL